jgi:hypothetical protein
MARPLKLKVSKDSDSGKWRVNVPPRLSPGGRRERRFFDTFGAATALSIRILAGEDAQAAARSEALQPVPMFDWRQLRQWNISEQRLPTGSIVRFKEATYWEKHYPVIVTALSLCLLEGLLIVALLVQLHRQAWQ